MRKVLCYTGSKPCQSLVLIRHLLVGHHSNFVLQKFHCSLWPVLQKIDKELETALATLEKEKEEALKDLDAQVLAEACQCLPILFHERKLFVQVGKLSGEILARVLPEGVKL